MMGNKTICVFTSNFYPYTGGLERYVHNFSYFLAQKGYKVYIITSNTLNAPEKEIFEGISIIRLPVIPLLSGRLPVPKFNSSFFKLMNEIKTIPADFYIANMRFYFTSLLCGIIGKRKHKPVFLIDHITGHQTLNNPLLDLISECYDHAMTFILKKYIFRFYGVSKAVCKWLEHFGIQDAEVVYNGIDILSASVSNPDFLDKYQITGEKVIITFAGRLIREKGAEILIQAFQKAFLSNKDIFLFIAGTGPISNELILKYGSVKNIIFTGELNQKDMFALLSNTHIVCVPSYFTEGMPTLILEGALHNCAVITTAMGGATEAVIDDSHGIVVPAKDTEALAQAIVKLAENKEYRENMAINLHNHVAKNFDWRNIIDIFAERLERYTNQY